MTAAPDCSSTTRRPSPRASFTVTDRTSPTRGQPAPVACAPWIVFTPMATAAWDSARDPLYSAWHGPLPGGAPTKLSVSERPSGLLSAESKLVLPDQNAERLKAG